MKLFKPFITASTALCFITPLGAQEIKHDKTIEEAVTKKVIEKIGSDLRGSIDYNEKPEIVTSSSAIQTENSVYQLPPVTALDEQPHMASLAENDEFGVDLTVTGSVPGKSGLTKLKIEWEKFDANGNPID